MALAATLHDPQGACLPMLEWPAVAPALATFPVVTVAATVATDARVTARLRELGAIVVEGGPTGVARRAALEAVPADLPSANIDFDRWLHWRAAWPEELAALPDTISRTVARHKPAPWCIVLGRTARAFRTHPPVQRLPETATNHTLSLRAGRRLDAVSGAVWLSSEGRAAVLAESVEAWASTDLEWAGLVMRHDPALLRGLRFEGLEWETPDFHAADIAAAGSYEAWLAAAFDTPAMWTSRLKLAADSVAALARVLGDG
ncbi:MAG: hypothetical protein QM692_16440 [Thermomicrobiales bacterium]